MSVFGIYGSKLCQKNPCAIATQTNHKKIFERVAKQLFQKFSWFGLERKAL
jgi:hypothetical protein